MGSEQNDGTSFPPAEPKLCVNGCGFFGTAANMNLCSKCYRDLRAEEEQAASAKAAMEKTLNINPKQHIDSKVVVDAPQVVVVANSVQLDVSAEASSSAETVVAGGGQVPSKPANRCFSCNKKVGLTGFKCKCGGTYCGTHRYAENHECLFDFKGAGRDAIAKANPVIKANKVERF
uniref:AN1-type domain-containing protein n=1 Tax=Populus davidiana TaxID=266767 RepID=A0A6M2FCU0_9ROSI